MTLNLNVSLLELVGDFRAKVLERIERREWHIAFFVANMIAEIGIAVLAVRVPDRFRRVYREPGRMPFVLKTHIAENEELGFGSEIDRVGDARGLEIALSPTPYAAGIQPVAFLGDRIDDIGNQAQSLVLHKRIDPVTV